METFKRAGSYQSAEDDELELKRKREGELSAMEYDDGELMLIELDERNMDHRVRIRKQRVAGEGGCY